MIYYFTSKKDTKCRLMKPIIDDLQKQFDITIMDINEHKTLIKNFEIMSLPTLSKGERRLSGVKSKETIIQFLRR